MSADNHNDQRPVELARRTGGGLAIVLLWHGRGNRVTVVVDDQRTGEWLELPVEDGTRALDVFHHPFAYAAVSPP